MGVHSVLRNTHRLQTLCPRASWRKSPEGPEGEGIHCETKLSHPFGNHRLAGVNFLVCFQSHWPFAWPRFRERANSNCASFWHLRLWNNRFYSFFESFLSKGPPSFKVSVEGKDGSHQVRGVDAEGGWMVEMTEHSFQAEGREYRTGLIDGVFSFSALWLDCLGCFTLLIDISSPQLYFKHLRNKYAAISLGFCGATRRSGCS